MISSQPFLLCIWCCAKRMNAAAARPKGIGPAPVTPPREQTWTSPAANQIKRERPPSLVTYDTHSSRAAKFLIAGVSGASREP